MKKNIFVKPEVKFVPCSIGTILDTSVTIDSITPGGDDGGIDAVAEAKRFGFDFVEEDDDYDY